MNGVSLQRKVLVTNPQGFHMRPMAAFAETALRFQSQVTVARTGYEADGKSPLSLMGLAALEGTELLLQVTGPDAQAALNALLELLSSLSVAAEVEDPELEVRGQKSEVRGQKSEVRGQKSEVSDEHDNSLGPGLPTSEH